VPLLRHFSGNTAILGVCLGHQAIVEAFGGRVVPAAAPIHGRASKVYHDGRSPIFDGVASPFIAGRYHSLIADPLTFPDSLTILARTADQTIMSVGHEAHPTFGVQFHPESILTEQGYQILYNFLRIAGVRLRRALSPSGEWVDQT
jgi:anthranilate synthase/aminodeoxychorismate synthase-like glutamine amidotransferase